ncbi:MAG TPA: flocculation-associated PEP-CTERM protein PepA [Burkholderiaceae bacterium]
MSLNLSSLQRTAVALAIAAAGSAAMAQTPPPPFTFDPAAVGLTGTSITGNNILISDYSKVTFTSASTFTETGYLVVTGFQSATDPSIAMPTGLGMYVKFDATGTTVGSNPSTSGTLATFTSLTYTLYGFNDVGGATFGFDAGGNAVETASGEVTLASGSLLAGGGSTLPDAASGKFYAFAGASLDFNIAQGAEGFFAAPNPFYDIALTTFSNTPDTVTPFSNGFYITQGGGKISFSPVTPVPEPETYALMLAGLGAVGFVARRRRAR